MNTRLNSLKNPAPNRKQRLHDAANPNLIEAYVNILDMRAEKKRAARILSEIVEFAPHDYGARQRYAKALAKRHDYTGSCVILSEAVQLIPAKRDTFRSMMALRRQQTELGRETMPVSSMVSPNCQTRMYPLY